MSALLVDEVRFDGRRSGGRRGFDGWDAADARPSRSGGRPHGVVRDGTAGGRPAPCDWGVPITGSPRHTVRLTERGIAVVLALFVGLFLAGAAVVVTSFLAVSDAPVSSSVAASGVVVRTAG